MLSKLCYVLYLCYAIGDVEVSKIKKVLPLKSINVLSEFHVNLLIKFCYFLCASENTGHH